MTAKCGFSGQRAAIEIRVKGPIRENTVPFVGTG